MAGRVQVAISADGTEIVGRVRGQGPPLVLVHGALGDGEIAYEALIPHLADRFTCYTPSTRGRGLSGDNPDHSPPRLQEDITAFVDSIGEPVCLVGWSGRGAWVLGAAAHDDTVAAVALYEPGVIGVGEKTTSPVSAPRCSRWARRLPTGGSSMRFRHGLRDRRPGGDTILRAMGRGHPSAAPIP